MPDVANRLRRRAPGPRPGLTDSPAGWLAAVIAATLVLGALALPIKVSLVHRAAVNAESELRQRVAHNIEREPRAGWSAEYRSATVAIHRLAAPSALALGSYRGADGEKITVPRIERFLKKAGSPLTSFAKDIVVAGIRYRVDPRVVVAISGVESTFGVHCVRHNAWGWGKARWSSWPQAIDSYTRLLGTSYHSLRLGRFAAASRTYCPPCGNTWGIKALSIFRQI